MSFSSFSSASGTSANEVAKYEGITNFAKTTGIGSLGIDLDKVDFWAANGATDWNQKFTTTNLPDFKGSVLDTPASSQGALSFTFITSPQQVSYSQSAEVQQVSIFGTNNPPITVAGNNAGELHLSEALMEGFVLGKQVQLPIENLLKMQEVTLTKGFVNVPVYKVYAGQSVGSGREYGNYVIESIDFDEMMRDASGKTTRAMVSVSFKEVPAYQINTGRDQSTATSGAEIIKPTKMAPGQAAGQDARTRAANSTGGTPAGGNSGGGGGGGGSNKSSAPVADVYVPGSNRIKSKL